MKSNFETFRISGQKKLSGSVEIGGSKNAALPILAASLVFEESIITRLPDISDVHLFQEMMTSLGAQITNKGDNIEINTKNLSFEDRFFDHIGTKKMRASILFLAPLLVRFGEVKMNFPGGCVLGKRSVDTHLRAFESLGVEILECEQYLHLKVGSNGLKGNTIILPEISVTATENAIIAACFAKGKTQIRLAATEPHVVNLCEFLISSGISIEGIGTHTLTIEASSNLKNPSIKITSDYLEVGTFILAGVLTDSEITVKNAPAHHLDSFIQKLYEVGANIQIDDSNETITTKPRKSDLSATNIQTGVFPKFPTDLHPQFGVLLTQCNGTSRIFETLFERKFAYLFELEKMNADIEILNPHIFMIHGPRKLFGAPVSSQDIRAGAAILLAALCAQGESEVSNIHYIDRGYPAIEKKLRQLGADISRKNG